MFAIDGRAGRESVMQRGAEELHRSMRVHERIVK